MMESLKQDLVDCIRMLEFAGLVNYNGHASIKISEHRILINSSSCPRNSLTVNDICEIDFDGNVIFGTDKPPIEFHLHVGIYEARSDVRAIVHAHPKWSTFLTMTNKEYLPVYAQGTLLYPMPVLETSKSINDKKIAKQLANVLSDRPAALLRAHGTVTVGESIQDAFVLANYLEENSYRQYMATAIGQPFVFSKKEIAEFKKRLWTPGLFKKTWNHFKAKIAP